MLGFDKPVKETVGWIGTAKISFEMDTERRRRRGKEEDMVGEKLELSVGDISICGEKRKKRRRKKKKKKGGEEEREEEERRKKKRKERKGEDKEEERRRREDVE